MSFKQLRDNFVWRMATGAAGYGIVLVAALVVIFEMTWTDSNTDDVALVVFVIVATLSSAWLAWYSRTAWSVLLIAPAAWLLTEATAPCVPEVHQTWTCTPASPDAATVVAITLSLIVGWAGGYLLSKQSRQAQSAN